MSACVIDHLWHLTETGYYVRQGGPYPPFTSDFQCEVELVIAIGCGGRDIAVADARDHIWGYAVGIDLTRRDRQRDARDLRLPWEVGKSFDASAPCGTITPARDARHFKGSNITLSVNGIERQRGDNPWPLEPHTAQRSHG